MRRLVLAIALCLACASAWAQAQSGGQPILLSGVSWTPTDASGAALTFTAVSAHYDRIGNRIFAYFALTYPATADASNANITGLPVAVPNQNYAQAPGVCWNNGGSAPIIIVPLKNGGAAGFLNHATGANSTNATLSTLTLVCNISYPAS